MAQESRLPHRMLRVPDHRLDGEWVVYAVGDDFKAEQLVTGHATREVAEDYARKARLRFGRVVCDGQMVTDEECDWG